MSKWKLIRCDAGDQRIWERVNSFDLPDSSIYIADHSGDRGEDGDRDTAGNPDQTDDGPLRIDPTRMAKIDSCHPYRFTVPVRVERAMVRGYDSWAGCSLKVFAKLQELVPALVVVPDVDLELIKGVLTINATRIDELARGEEKGVSEEENAAIYGILTGGMSP